MLIKPSSQSGTPWLLQTLSVCNDIFMTWGNEQKEYLHQEQDKKTDNVWRSRSLTDCDLSDSDLVSKLSSTDRSLERYFFCIFLLIFFFCKYSFIRKSSVWSSKSGDNWRWCRIKTMLIDVLTYFLLWQTRTIESIKEKSMCS